ncbi:WD40 repeat-like protein [Sistotremastrum suecicum HHB10207 ss-3]|uniref:WD40 repeat-like protein n=1 Tax=Sistotremastrum suecicum HHB10207 ss-3 TaxID=1314776 RepID=A0A165YT52_9AGAM|nr:WD40 repeat-like protein [Sistotremastrum suecicum HHB10207 ss-3]
MSPGLINKDESTRPRKKLRAEPEPSTSTPSTQLFAPFRALGFVTNNVPFVLQVRSYKGASSGPRIHILTCLGREWALWEGGKMTLLFVGSQTEEQISSLALDGDFVWSAVGAYVLKFERGKQVHRLENPLGTPLTSLLVFGDQLLALTTDGRRLLAWSTKTYELISTLEFSNDITATTVIHPATYINKVLVSSTQGILELWNLSTKTRIHRFAADSLADSPSPITALVQSPAIDVVAVGFASGEISVYDIRTDERLMRMFQEGGAVRSLGFRGDGESVLASASSAGHVVLWDLNEGGRLLHVLRGAHDAPITAVEWIPGQPVLVTSGEDNSVKQWFFESPTAPPRLLKFRSGHHAPPHLIRFYGSDGKALLTASRDRSLRYTSVVRDSRSFELSQGPLAKKATNLSIPLASLKLPSVSTLAFSNTRSKDWDDVLTAHTGDSFARTWTVQNKKLGSYSFGVHSQKDEKNSKSQPQGAVQAVCVSACGNFGLAASAKGVIGMWNMQSGIKRKTFKLPPVPAEVSNVFKAKKSERTVTGLATDALNRIVVVATLDGTINFFDFHSTELTSTLILPSSATSILLQRDNGLLAVVCDDLIVRIIDIETTRIVRELRGFRGRILDIDFSPDSRWLIATSLDSAIRTFDVPTGRMIDAFKTSRVATSIAFSPTGDFLATAHVDSVGIYLWANRSQYGEVALRILDQDESLVSVGLPSMQGTAEDEALDELAALNINDAKPANPMISPDQLEGELITLTLLPRSRWQTLLNFDVIQRRNKPKEPPKVSEKAPFFLPTLPGVDHRFDVEKAAKTSESKKSTKHLPNAAANLKTQFQEVLHKEDAEGNYDAFFDYIKNLSPAAIDLELRSLVSLDDISTFMAAIERRLISHRDFELVQTLLNVFLRMHGELLVENVELKDKLVELMDVQMKKSGKLLELIASSLGTLGFLRDGP